MLHAAEALHRIITTMVVGEEEAFGTHHFTAAETATQTHHRILDAAAVDVVDVFGGKLETELLHLGLVDLLQFGKQPHALMGL